jgi:hypothetical protein
VLDFFLTKNMVTIRLACLEEMMGSLGARGSSSTRLLESRERCLTRLEAQGAGLGLLGQGLCHSWHGEGESERRS